LLFSDLCLIFWTFSSASLVHGQEVFYFDFSSLFNLPLLRGAGYPSLGWLFVSFRGGAFRDGVVFVEGGQCSGFVLMKFKSVAQLRTLPRFDLAVESRVASSGFSRWFASPPPGGKFRLSSPPVFAGPASLRFDRFPPPLTPVEKLNPFFSASRQRYPFWLISVDS